MTYKDIDLIFPPDYSSNAQISDLRLLLSALIRTGEIGKSEFNVVATISDRNNLTPAQGDMCRVVSNNIGQQETYIFDDNLWQTLVKGGGSGGANYTEVTQNVVVSFAQESLQQIDLSNIPDPSKHLMVYLNGMLLMLGTTLDYTIISNTIGFNNPIEAGDHVSILYSY